MDPRITKLADILVNYSIKVQPGNWVVINGHALSAPLINEVVRHILLAGGQVNTMLFSDEIGETVLKHSNEEQLKWVSPISKLIYDQVDATIGIIATSNTRALSGVDPKKQAARQAANRELTEKFMERSARGELRWVGTQYPCPANAQDADMSLSEYEDFVYRATFADQEDPVAKWMEFHDRQQRLIEWLIGKDQVVIRGPNVDLSLSIQDRVFINADGEKNMPDGEIFTGPVEGSANGWVRFTYPALRGGKEVDGVDFKFEDGKVIEARAEKNEEYLLSQLDTDSGARYLGEFAIGTNYGIQQFTKNILFDEKIGGTFHIAVGAGYPETGSVNQSAIHWDFICDMRTDSEIFVDGDLFYKDGEFQV